MTVHFIGAGPGAADLVTVRAARLLAARGAGQDVARLHSGDPSVYSAMAEQMRRLDAAGVPYDVVPGVPAFAAAAATLNRELTVPGVGQTVVLTRTSARSTPMPAGESLAAYAATRATLVLHLAVQRLDELVPELAAHYGADCPVAVVARASHDDELVLRGTLADIAGQVSAAGVQRT